MSIFNADDNLADVPFRADAVLEALPDGFQAFDHDFRFLYLNIQAERMLGRSRGSLIGRVCWDEYPDMIDTPLYDRFREAMSSRRTLVFENFDPRQERWLEFTLQPVPGGLGAFTKDVTDKKLHDLAVVASERHYRALFDRVLDAVLMADDSGRYIDANPAACELFGEGFETLLGKSIADFAPKEAAPFVASMWSDFLKVGEQSGEFVLNRPDGVEKILEYRAKANVLPGIHLSVLRDITERKRREEELRVAGELLADATDHLREESEALDTLNRVGRVISAELDLEKLVQQATDAATEMTEAEFGAFFYNIVDENGNSYQLYTISGVDRSHFDCFPMPRATGLFGPTFRGEGTIRIGDVTNDQRYGKMPPHFGMPKGHLPVRSYLAVPVISRTGNVLGGLFLGHATPDSFSERDERNVEALVAQVAVGMDNAQLFGQAQKEISERQRAEEMLRLSQVQTKSFLRDVMASVTEGRLRLCDTAEDLPAPLEGMYAVIDISRDSLAMVRQRTRDAATAAMLVRERCHDLLTATSEAAMNAIVHAGGGRAVISVARGEGIVQVRIEDSGLGIDMARIPRATLERGYTSGEGFGHGFWLMLNTTDRVWLLTGPTGTTVVIEHGQEPPPPGWLRAIL